MREIEIKLRVDNLEEVASLLLARGCELSSPFHQHDVTYTKGGSTAEWQASKEGHTVMRIRRLANGTLLAYKEQKLGEMDNIEHETEVGDADTAHQILLALGFVPGVEVKKLRRKGKLGEYEICLDEVEGLGTFIELEKLAPEEVDAELVREELFATLESLGLSRDREEKRGYDTQVFQKLQGK